MRMTFKVDISSEHQKCLCDFTPGAIFNKVYQQPGRGYVEMSIYLLKDVNFLVDINPEQFIFACVTSHQVSAAGAGLCREATKHCNKVFGGISLSGGGR